MADSQNVPGNILLPDILLIDKIGKQFSGVKVLDDISFAIRRGEIMGLIGENGVNAKTKKRRKKNENNPIKNYTI